MGRSGFATFELAGDGLDEAWLAEVVSARMNPALEERGGGKSATISSVPFLARSNR